MTRKYRPYVFIREGFALPDKEAPFLHLKRKLPKLVATAEEAGVAHMCVSYDTPQQLVQAVEWMKDQGRKAINSGADVSIFTDTSGNGKPRLWVQVITNNEAE